MLAKPTEIEWDYVSHEGYLNGKQGTVHGKKVGDLEVIHKQVEDDAEVIIRQGITEVYIAREYLFDIGSILLAVQNSEGESNGDN